MTGEDLGYQQGIVRQFKFEYSPSGKVSNEVLKEDDKKEGVLKSLKNIESKNKE